MLLLEWLRPPVRAARRPANASGKVRAHGLSSNRRAGVATRVAAAVCTLAVVGVTAGAAQTAAAADDSRSTRSSSSSSKASPSTPRSGTKPAARPWAFKRPETAWLSAKSLCVLPLARSEMPRTGGRLAQSIADGWKGALTFPDQAKVVDLAGGRYPAVESMFVDLSGAVANPKLKPGGASRVPDLIPSNRSVAADRFVMVAEPLVSHGGRVAMRMTGTNVRFDLQHDRDGRPLLMLADARAGAVQFDTTEADLERMLLASLRQQSKGRPFTVRSVELDLHAIDTRSLTVDLRVSTLVGFVPAGLRFRARVDIDERMNARISGLECDGDELLGPIIVGLVRPGMAKYEGKTRPLIGFPSGNLKLRDVDIRTGERVQLTATFGADAPTPVPAANVIARGGPAR